MSRGRGRAKRSGEYLRSVTGGVVGVVSGKVFKRHCKASRHFLRVPPGIAFLRDNLVEAQRLGADRVEVKDDESGAVYSAEIVEVLTCGIEIDRGYGDQVALPLDKFTVTTTNKLWEV